MLQEILQSLSSSKSAKGSSSSSNGVSEESGELFAGLFNQALKSTLKGGTLASTLTQKLEKQKNSLSVERGEKSSLGVPSNLLSPSSPFLSSLSAQGLKGTLKEAGGTLKELLEEAKNAIKEAKSSPKEILNAANTPVQSSLLETPKETKKLSDVAKIAEDLALKSSSIKAQSETLAEVSPKSTLIKEELKNSQALEKTVEKSTPKNAEISSATPIVKREKPTKEEENQKGETSPKTPSAPSSKDTPLQDKPKDKEELSLVKNRSLALDSDPSILKPTGENMRQEGAKKAPQAEANLAGILTLTKEKKNSIKASQEAIATEKQEAKESQKEKSQEKIKETSKETTNEAIKEVIKGGASSKESPSKGSQESPKNPIASAILESKELTPKNQNMGDNSQGAQAAENALKSALEELVGTGGKQASLGKKEERESKEATSGKSEASMGLEGRLSSLGETKGDLALKSALAKETLKNFTATLKEEVQNYKPPLTKLSVELNPENLGSVELTITQRGQNLLVQVVSNTQAIQLFMNNTAEFRQQLANAGFGDVSMSFSDGSASSGGFGGGDSSGGHPQKGNENGLFAYKANALGGADLEESERLGLMEITLPKYA
ncbi:flagellar hook-length control protein FliK [Wolinella succinogenes]|uniref:flagellar hook-length control protein FliK n=1 Tax=Wolinella succinogenes TaxID=844 RepID=UPI00240A6DF3|nr:flagellar hook-length control protein FliK [Wolinella succinogenes]